MKICLFTQSFPDICIVSGIFISYSVFELCATLLVLLLELFQHWPSGALSFGVCAPLTSPLHPCRGFWFSGQLIGLEAVYLFIFLVLPYFLALPDTPGSPYILPTQPQNRPFLPRALFLLLEEDVRHQALKAGVLVATGVIWLYFQYRLKNF